MQRLSGLALVLPDGVSLLGVVDEWGTFWGIRASLQKKEPLSVVFLFLNFAPDRGSIVFV